MLRRTPEGRNYHHGNVKEALVDEAIKFIEANSPERLSLRLLARKVGISPSAVYNHFADKNALMLAVKLRLYQDINGYFEFFCKTTDDPEQALLNNCLAYYHYARENPVAFDILFSATVPTELSTQEYIEVSCRSLAETRKTVSRVYEKFLLESLEGELDEAHEQETVNTTILLWSQIHGIIALQRSGSVQAAVTYLDWPQPCALGTDEDVRQMISQQVRMTINAIATRCARQDSVELTA